MRTIIIATFVLMLGTSQATAHHEHSFFDGLDLIQQEKMDERLQEFGQEALGISKDLLEGLLNLSRSGISEIQKELEGILDQTPQNDTKNESVSA